MNKTEPRAPSGVHHRRLHYFSGFDPRGAAHYHRLCRDEAGKPQPDGCALVVGAREKLSPRVSRWTVEWKRSPESGSCVKTEHVFMGWDDIVRAHWTREPLRFLGEFFQTYAHLFRHIGAARVWHMYRPAFKAGILPLVLALLPILLAFALWGTLGAWPGMAMLVLGIGGWLLAGRAGLFWLLRIYNFFRRIAVGPICGLDGRSREWVEFVIARQSEDPADEVLLVGHSVGTVVMVDAVDALLRDPRWQTLQGARPTVMLTLGHSIPMVTMVPPAHEFRAAVQRLTRHPKLCWWDVTARIDPLCFYNLHPLAGSNLPHRDARWPLLHTARFMHMYEPGAWGRIRSNKLHAHFLYLHTPQKPGNFSPFDVFYGPRRLEDRIGVSESRANG
jgi:hypothetical protein